MRTPTGRECRFYYADFHRGRQVQECRLIARACTRSAAEGVRESPPWTPGLCQTCPVPGILLANACPNLILDAHVARSLFGLVQRVEVEGWCSKTLTVVEKPEVGCGHCHE